MDRPGDVEVVPSTGATAAAETKPLLRGWLHLVCAFLAVPTAAWVIAVADGGRARVGATVYGIGLVALFTVKRLGLRK
jgi:predicted membrane channel-forming protein YqfA (hemolysin III family)